MKDLIFFGSEAVFHHTGLVVASIEDCVPGLTIFEDPKQKVKVAFARINGVLVEFVEPLGDDSPVMESLQKGLKLAHLCYEVPDIDKAIQYGKDRGFHQLSSAVPAVAFEGRKIAWVFNRHFGLFELLEKGEETPPLRNLE